MEILDNYYEKGEHAYINDPGLTPQERYQAALDLALGTANVSPDELQRYAETSRSLAEPRPDISQLAQEARRNGQAVWGAGIISVFNASSMPGHHQRITAA